MEKDEELRDIVERHRHTKSPLIPVLHEVQELYGFIPRTAQELIAAELKIPMPDIYGVITFYSRFTLAPKGKYRIFVCKGTACYVKGAEKVLEAVKNNLGVDTKETTGDGLFSIEDTRCVGACGLAPVMMINEDVYARMTPERVAEILSKYRDKE